MYQEVCKVYITSSIIKDMKIEPRNKWRKADSVIFDTSLDTSIYQNLMKKLDIELKLVTYWDPCK